MKDFLSVIVQSIMAFLGSLGFSLIFNVKRRHVVIASLGGMFTWMAYFVCKNMGNNILLSTVIASAFAAAYSMVTAVRKKAPANQFLIIALIPLIPGAPLFYTMISTVQSEWQQSSHYGQELIQFVLGLAIGISLVWGIEKVIVNWRRKRVSHSSH